jgi:hypothetical protein
LYSLIQCRIGNIFEVKTTQFNIRKHDRLVEIYNQSMHQVSNFALVECVTNVTKLRPKNEQSSSNFRNWERGNVR